MTERCFPSHLQPQEGLVHMMYAADSSFLGKMNAVLQARFHLDVQQVLSTLNKDIQTTGLDDSEIQVLYNVL